MCGGDRLRRCALARVPALCSGTVCGSPRMHANVCSTCQSMELIPRYHGVWWFVTRARGLRSHGDERFEGDDGSAVGFPGERGNRNRTRDQQLRLSTRLRNNPQLVCGAILPTKKSQPNRYLTAHLDNHLSFI